MCSNCGYDYDPDSDSVELESDPEPDLDYAPPLYEPDSAPIVIVLVAYIGALIACSLFWYIVFSWIVRHV